MRELAYAELLTARFCHDIAGPVGAVNNGIEFLAEDEFNMQGEAFHLVEKSAKEAVARLRFFRQAYGAIKASGEANLAQLKEVAEALFSFSKVQLDWSDAYVHNTECVVSQLQGKILLNLYIVSLDILIYGGTLSLFIGADASDGAPVMRLTLDGEHNGGRGIKSDEQIEALLSGKAGDDVELNTHNIQHYYTYLLAKEAGNRINVEYKDASCIVTVNLLSV